MPQYRPEHRAREFPELARRILPGEWEQALAWARDAGLTNLDTGVRDTPLVLPARAMTGGRPVPFPPPGRDLR